MDEKPCEQIVKNILLERCLATYYLPLCMNDYAKGARLKCASRMLIANERLGQLVQRKTFSKNRRITFQQIHELDPGTLISLNLTSEALNTSAASFSFTAPPSIGTERLQ